MLSTAAATKCSRHSLSFELYSSLTHERIARWAALTRARTNRKFYPRWRRHERGRESSRVAKGHSPRYFPRHFEQLNIYSVLRYRPLRVRSETRRTFGARNAHNRFPLPTMPGIEPVLSLYHRLSTHQSDHYWNCESAGNKRSSQSLEHLTVRVTVQRETQF